MQLDASKQNIKQYVSKLNYKIFTINLYRILK